jgi:hypothetical protein
MLQLTTETFSIVFKVPPITLILVKVHILVSTLTLKHEHTLPAVKVHSTLTADWGPNELLHDSCDFYNASLL